MDKYWLALVLLIVAAVGCCGTSTVTTIIPIDESPILHHDGNGGDVKVRMADDELAVPQDFPDDVPIFAGSRLDVIMTAKEGWFASLVSLDAPESVKAFYDKQLPEQGWELSPSELKSSGAVLTAKKAGRELLIVVEEAGGESNIAITVDN